MGELGEFVKHDADFKKLDVQVLAISVDPPEKGKWVEEKLKAPFLILSDSKREVMELYGTRSTAYHNREGGNGREYIEFKPGPCEVDVYDDFHSVRLLHATGTLAMEGSVPTIRV